MACSDIRLSPPILRQEYPIDGFRGRPGRSVPCNAVDDAIFLEISTDRRLRLQAGHAHQRGEIDDHRLANVEFFGGLSARM
jgi:hypothetical protein